MIDNYPIGADYDKNAPWKEEAQPSQKVKVAISITLSKTVEVSVNDYEATPYVDEDGSWSEYDYSNCNLEEAVQEQIILPSEKFKDWIVDDFEVMLDE